MPCFKQGITVMLVLLFSVSTPTYSPAVSSTAGAGQAKEIATAALETSKLAKTAVAAQSDTLHSDAGVLADLSEVIPALSTYEMERRLGELFNL